MTSTAPDASMVAYCGLYCGCCGARVKGRCPGCHGNQKAAWCKVRACCMERGYQSCADCVDHAGPRTCKKFNNFISKVIGFVLRSDRAACVAQIKKLGAQGHAEVMAAQGRHSIRRGAAG